MNVAAFSPDTPVFVNNLGNHGSSSLEHDTNSTPLALGKRNTPIFFLERERKDLTNLHTERKTPHLKFTTQIYQAM